MPCNLIFHRQAYADVPPRVEYTLTERGHSLVPLLWSLVEWAKINMKPIERARKKYFFENCYKKITFAEIFLSGIKWDISICETTSYICSLYAL